MCENKEYLSSDNHLVVQFGSCSFDIHERKQGPHVLIQTGREHYRIVMAINDLFESLKKNYTAKDVGVCVLDPGDGLHLEEKNIPYCICHYHGSDSWNMMLYYIREEYGRRKWLLEDSHCTYQSEYIRKTSQAEDKKETMPHLIVLVYLESFESEKAAELIANIRTARSLGFHLMLMTPDMDAVPPSFLSNCRLYLNLADDAPVRVASEYGVQVYQVYNKDANRTGTHYAVFETDHGVNKADLYWRWSVRSYSGKEKQIKLIRGDLTELQGPCDAVVCSAFRNDYLPTPGSLIGSLYHKGYDLKWLRRKPELYMQFQDGWISGETGLDYKRIVCIELLDLMKDDPDSEESVNIIIKKSFSTLRYMLEQASLSGIPVKTLAMTIPGTGNQGIKFCYILAPLIAHCRSLLEMDIVDEITIYDWGMNAVTEIAPALDQAFSVKQDHPDIFISYSSKQQQTAHEICNAIRKNGIQCWIAPESIPAGCDYLELIPDAISSVKLILLILTPDAVKSGWVRREITSAIGAGKDILPFQIIEFEVDKKFMFLLDGEQIMHYRAQNAADVDPEETYSELIIRIRDIVNM